MCMNSISFDSSFSYRYNVDLLSVEGAPGPPAISQTLDAFSALPLEAGIRFTNTSIVGLAFAGASQIPG